MGKPFVPRDFLLGNDPESSVITFSIKSAFKYITVFWESIGKRYSIILSGSSLDWALSSTGFIKFSKNRILKYGAINSIQDGYIWEQGTILYSKVRHCYHPDQVYDGGYIGAYFCYIRLTTYSMLPSACLRADSFSAVGVSYWGWHSLTDFSNTSIGKWQLYRTLYWRPSKPPIL